MGHVLDLQKNVFSSDYVMILEQTIAKKQQRNWKASQNDWVCWVCEYYCDT